MIIGFDSSRRHNCSKYLWINQQFYNTWQKIWQKRRKRKHFSPRNWTVHRKSWWVRKTTTLVTNLPYLTLVDQCPQQQENRIHIFSRTYASKYFIFLFFFLIYLFIFGCVGCSFLCEGFLQLRRAGATLRGARASHCRGLFRCGAQAPDAQAQ